AGGEAVQEGLAADGADLAVAEKAGERDRAELGGHAARVVVGGAEQAGAAAVAATEHGGGRPGLAQGLGGGGGPLAQVLVGGGGVAHLELERLADARVGADADGAALAVDTGEVADQVVAAAKLVLVLVDGEADEQVAGGALLHLGGELLHRLDQHLVGGAAAAGLEHGSTPAPDP